jgi:hypothetical protein
VGEWCGTGEVSSRDRYYFIGIFMLPSNSFLEKSVITPR